MHTMASLLGAATLLAFLFPRPVLSQGQNASGPPCRALPLQGKTLFQFNQTDQWIENVATRQNGDLLFTMAGPRAQVWLMKNTSAANPRVQLVHDFSSTIEAQTKGNTSASGGPSVLVGIVEPRPDVFVTAGGQLTSRRTSVADTWSVFELAFQDQTDATAVRKIVDLPNAGFPNGVVAVGPAGSASTVLVGDSTRGLVYRVDVMNNTVTTAMQLDAMAPRPDGQPPFGINGMKVRGDTLYFDNSNDRAFYSVRIKADGSGTAPGSTVQKMASADKVARYVDDFDLETDGTIWATGGFGNTLLAVDPATKEAVVVAGSEKSLTVAGPTAAVLGRGDSRMLYVVTAGAQGDPINGTVMEPGKIMRFNISAFSACKSGKSSAESGGGGGASGGDDGNPVATAITSPGAVRATAQAQSHGAGGGLQFGTVSSVVNTMFAACAFLLFL